MAIPHLKKKKFGLSVEQMCGAAIFSFTMERQEPVWPEVSAM
jgi:hypothetical protein